MNIIKIQDQLKSIPDQTLVGYVQNPTGQVPTYLALSELQRRKEMRQNYQANKPKEKTVAEDLVQETEPGIAALPEGQPMQQAMQPTPEMPMEQMAQGGLAELDTGDMYDENNYATGGIVAFSQGGSPDRYGVVMPTVPTMDDMYMQSLDAQSHFGVDPDFYKKTLEESKTERLKELEDAKKMDQAQLLLAMGSAFAGTPTFGKALSVAGEKAAPIVGAMGKTQREINNMYRMADRKTLEAQYAQARGDATAAQKAITDKENLLLSAQLEEAKLKSAEGIAARKASATAAGKNEKIRSSILGNAYKDFANAFPNGAQETVFGNDPGFFQYVKNNYIQNAKDFIENGQMPVIPNASQLRDMYDAYKKLPASKQGATDTKRPAHINAIMNKYSDTSQKSKIRNTNTQEELDTDWDSAGTGLDEED